MAKNANQGLDTIPMSVGNRFSASIHAPELAALTTSALMPAVSSVVRGALIHRAQRSVPNPVLHV